MSGLVTGLQNRARRFESARHLHKTQKSRTAKVDTGFCKYNNLHYEKKPRNHLHSRWMEA